MSSRLSRILLGIVSFCAPAGVAAAAMLGALESGALLWMSGLASVVVGAVVPARLFLRSQLPPNTRIGLAIVVVTLLLAECLSIAYINWVSGLTP